MRPFPVQASLFLGTKKYQVSKTAIWVSLLAGRMFLLVGHQGLINFTLRLLLLLRHEPPNRPTIPLEKPRHAIPFTIHISTFLKSPRAFTATSSCLPSTPPPPLRSIRKISVFLCSGMAGWLAGFRRSEWRRKLHFIGKTAVADMCNLYAVIANITVKFAIIELNHLLTEATCEKKWGK